MFGIRSIPTCVLLKNSQPVDGFMGAQPEGQVRAFLDKHVPSEGALEAEADVDEAHELLESGDTQAALSRWPMPWLPTPPTTTPALTTCAC